MEFVKDVLGKRGARQSCDHVVDVVLLRQREEDPIIRPLMVEFRSEYDKWTVMRMKTWLQTTQPTSGGAVTAVTNCCANCVEPSRP